MSESRFASIGATLARRWRLVLIGWAIALVGLGALLPTFRENLTGASYAVDGSGSERAAEILNERFPQAGAEQDLAVFRSSQLTVRDPRYRRAVEAALKRLLRHPLVVNATSPYARDAQSLVGSGGRVAGAVVALKGSAGERQDAVPRLQELLAVPAGIPVESYLTGSSPIKRGAGRRGDAEPRGSRGDRRSGCPRRAPRGVRHRRLGARSPGTCRRRLDRGLRDPRRPQPGVRLQRHRGVDRHHARPRARHRLLAVRPHPLSGGDRRRPRRTGGGRHGDGDLRQGCPVFRHDSGDLPGGPLPRAVRHLPGAGHRRDRRRRRDGDRGSDPASRGPRAPRVAGQPARAPVPPPPDHPPRSREQPLGPVGAAGHAPPRRPWRDRRRRPDRAHGPGARHPPRDRSRRQLARRARGGHRAADRLRRPLTGSLDAHRDRARGPRRRIRQAPAERDGAARERASRRAAAERGHDDPTAAQRGRRHGRPLRHRRCGRGLQGGGGPGGADPLGGGAAGAGWLGGLRFGRRPQRPDRRFGRGDPPGDADRPRRRPGRQLHPPAARLPEPPASAEGGGDESAQRRRRDGALVIVFQRGAGEELLDFTSPGYLQVFQPRFTFAILFGLSMDYEVFLISRMKEEWARRGDNAAAVSTGMAHPARVVTAAATIMVTVFAAFLFAEIRELKQIGFALAVAVLIDATVVRILLVPALMRLMGRWNWWLPAPLARRLPRIELSEGASGSRS